jgi:hypothetical protein
MPGARSSHRHLAVGALLLVITLLVYANSLQAEFVLDNRIIILEDPRIRRVTAENLALIFTRDYWWPKHVTGVYRPLVTLSYLFNYTVLGGAERPPGYHALNLLTHFGNSVLVYLLVLMLVGAFWPALWTGIVFATHPIATEAVTNVVGRADLFAAFAVLSGLVLYVKSTRVDGWHALPWLVGLALAAGVGLLSKESAVALLGLVLAYDLVYPAAARRRAWLGHVRPSGWLALLPVVLALGYLRMRLRPNLGPRIQPFGDNPLLAADFWTARATAIKVIGKELWLLLWPRQLSCDYAYDQIPLVTWPLAGWEDWKAVGALATIAVLAAVAIRQSRRSPALTFLIAFLFVALLPSANLILLIGSIMAERFLYLPSVAFAAALVMAVFAACRRVVPRRADLVAGALLGAVVLAYGVRTARRNVDWQDGVRLWSSAVAAAPKSFRTHDGLAGALYARDGPEYPNIDTIIREGETALAVLDAKPLPPVDQPAEVPMRLGIYYWVKGQTLAAHGAPAEERTHWSEKAIAMLTRAAALEQVQNAEYRRRQLAYGLDPEKILELGEWSTHQYLGTARLQMGRYTEALDAFAHQRRLWPDRAQVYRNFAQVHLATGQSESAAVSLLQVLTLAPGDREALRSLVELYGRLDGGQCAVVPGEGTGMLNFRCPLVHGHLCRAYGEFERLFHGARLEGHARQVREWALRNACPANASG